MRYLIPSLLLLACTGKTETKTAIFIELTDGSSTAEGSESSTLANYASTLWVYVDPESDSFYNNSMVPYEEGPLSMGISSSFGDYVIDDSDLELGIEILSNWSGIVPVIELESQQPRTFLFRAVGFQGDGGIQTLESEVNCSFCSR